MSAATDPLKGLLPSDSIEAMETLLAEIADGTVDRRIAANAVWERIWQQRQDEIEEEI